MQKLLSLTSDFDVAQQKQEVLQTEVVAVRDPVASLLTGVGCSIKWSESVRAALRQKVFDADIIEEREFVLERRLNAPYAKLSSLKVGCASFRWDRVKLDARVARFCEDLGDDRELVFQHSIDGKEQSAQVF